MVQAHLTSGVSPASSTTSTSVTLPEQTPIPRSEYIEEHLEWFRILREYHDYVTQYGSIDISFCEAREGVVRMYLQDALQVHEVVAPVAAALEDPSRQLADRLVIVHDQDARYG